MLIFLVSCSAKDIDIEGKPVPNLRSWLAVNDNIRNEIKWEEDNNPSYWYGGTLSELIYDNWPENDKIALDDSFERAWQWLYQSQETSILGSEEFSMPLKCTYCEGRLVSHPTSGPFTVIDEDLSKKVYITYVAHSLAVEIGGIVNWSIANSSPSELHHYFNSRSLMHRVGALGNAEFFFGNPGGGGDARIKYLGNVSPATPIYAYRWMVNSGLLQSSHEATIKAVLTWFRDNAVHFYGGYTYENANDHWGYPSQTSAYHLIKGTVRESESSPKHWTAGCHGTAGFIKSVFKTINIPVEIIYTCGHAQLYFPTIGKYMDHGDNPYNANVRSQTSKDIGGILIDQATYTARFGANPDYHDTGDPECTYIGYAATNF
jgi:hypothetical protein